MRFRLVRCVVAGLACALAIAPQASAQAIHTQSPVTFLNFAWPSGPATRQAAPFVSPMESRVTGIAFWAWNSNSVFAQIGSSIRVEIFSEQAGGGIGASMFSSIVPTASLQTQSTRSTIATRFEYTLPVAQDFEAGNRYFLSISNATGGNMGWVSGVSGEKLFTSSNGGTFQPAAQGTTAFEVLGRAIVVPLPTPAALTVCGLAALAVRRRRRDA